MDQTLFDRASSLFSRVADTDECRRRTADYEHAYQFEVDGQPMFYVAIDHGSLTVESGGLEGPPTKVSLVKTDSATLGSIFNGKLRALEASKKGKWVIRARNYSGELLYNLLRIGRDLTIQDLLEAQV